MKNPVTYMFQDNDFLAKGGLLFSLTAVSIILQLAGKSLGVLAVILNIIIGLIVYGYFYSVINSVIENDGEDDIVLPKFDFAGDFFKGLKASAATFVVSFIIGLISAFTLYIPMIIFLFLLPAIMWIFAEQNTFGSFFAWGRAFEIIKENFIKYIGYIIGICVYFVIIGIIFFIFIALFNSQLAGLKTGNIDGLTLTALTIFCSMIAVHSTYFMGYMIGDLYKSDSCD